MTNFSLPEGFFQPESHRDAKNLVLALPILVRALTDNHHIKVTVKRGVGIAWTDTTTLAIEAFPLPKQNADVTDLDTVLTLYTGGIYHEIGHHRHSDLPVLLKALNASPELLVGLMKAIEDPRMEQAMGLEYPGADRHLRRLSNLMVDTGRFRSVTSDKAPAAALTYWCMHWLRAHLRKEPALEPIAQEGETAVRALFGDTLIDKILVILENALGMKSMSDALDTARAIYALVETTANSEPDDDANSNEGESEPSQDSSEGASSPGTANASTPPGDVSLTPQAAAQQALAATAEEVVPDLGDLVSQTLASTLASMQATGQIDGERNTSMPPGTGPGGPATVSDRQLIPIDVQKAQGLCGRLRQRLITQVQARARARTLHHRRGNRLDPSVLFRAGSGDPRVFLVEREEKGINTALFLLLDVSGSMRTENRFAVANQAMLATALAADMVPGLALAAGIFPYQKFIKRFGERAKVASRQFGVAPDGRDTPLSDGVLFATRELARRDEPRRMLVIATDGQPNSVPQAKQALATARAMGIEVYGIGIGVNVSHVLPQSRRLTDIEALPHVMFELLDNATLTDAA